MVSSIENDQIFLVDTDGTLTGITTPDHSEPGSNGNGGICYVTQSPRMGTKPSDAV